MRDANSGFVKPLQEFSRSYRGDTPHAHIHTHTHLTVAKTVVDPLLVGGVSVWMMARRTESGSVDGSWDAQEAT